MSLYDIEKIKIMIKSNIPDKEPVSFDSKMLYTSKKTGYSDYPYITKQVKYPYDELVKMEYSDITDFFFIKNVFIQTLLPESKKQNIDQKETPANKKNRENTNIEYNIITMLELLFPTYYPTHNNFYISFVSNIGGEMEIPQKSMFGNKNKRFSYINIDKPYTISKITWLNDIVNHPTYGEFIDDFYNYKKWAEMVIPEINNKLKTSEDDIELLIKTEEDSVIENEVLTLRKYLNEQRINNRNIDSQRNFMINGIIQILQVIIEYKQYLNKIIDSAKFQDNYKKIIQGSVFIQGSWVEYNPPASGPDVSESEWWYPVKIKNANQDGTYNIEIFKNEKNRLTNVYESEIQYDVNASKLRQISFIPTSEMSTNYQYANPLVRNGNKLELLFTALAIPKPSEKFGLFEQILIDSVNTRDGKIQITYEIDDASNKKKLKSENIEFFYLRSNIKTNDIKISDTPDKLLMDSLYKLKESYEKSGYNNFSLKFKTFIQKLLEFNDKIIQYSTFQNLYLNTDCDYLKFDVKFKVEEEFEQFTEMSKSIQKIVSSSTKTNNNTLQNLIDDYVNNSKKYEIDIEKSGKTCKSHLFYELLNYIIDCYWLNSNPSKESIRNIYEIYKKSLVARAPAALNEDIEMFEKFINQNDKTIFKTSINRINLKGGKILPHYEIYIAADLLAGDGNKVIDETNVNKIKCAYNDYNATKSFNKYNHNPYIVEQGPLIELPKNSEKDLIKNPPIQNGGKTKKQRNKNKKRSRKQTRKIK